MVSSRDKESICIVCVWDGGGRYTVVQYIKRQKLVYI